MAKLEWHDFGLKIASKNSIVYPTLKTMKKYFKYSFSDYRERSRESSYVERNEPYQTSYDERIKPDGFGNPIPFQQTQNHQRQHHQPQQYQQQTQQQHRTQRQHEEQLRQKIEQMTVQQQQSQSNIKHQPTGINSKPRRIMRGRGKQIKTT